MYYQNENLVGQKYKNELLNVSTKQNVKLMVF